MTIDQILTQLEEQKASIDRAIAALRELSGIALQPGLPAAQGMVSAAKRGRPPRRPEATATVGADGQRRGSARKRLNKRAASKASFTRPVYSDDFRRRVVTAVRKGMSFGEAAKKFKVTWFSVREWVNSGRFEPIAAKKGAPAKAAVKKRAQVNKTAPTKRNAPGQKERFPN